MTQEKVNQIIKRRQYVATGGFEAFRRQSEEGFAPDLATVHSGVHLWADPDFEKGKSWDGVKDPVHFRVGTYGDFFVDRATFLKSTRLVNR